MALFSLFLLVPCRWFVKQVQQPMGLEKTILFGRYFEKGSLPAVRKLNPPRESEFGFDGQFYAQLAFDPALRNPDLMMALDNPTYRSKRIGLPILAYSAGLFEPSLRLKIYALINPLCWLVLLVILAFSFFDLKHWKEWPCLLACVLGSGVLYSLARSLTDMPSALFSLLGLVQSAGWAGGLCFTMAILTKETACFSLLAASEFRFNKRKVLSTEIIRIALILFVPFFWWIYVSWIFPVGGVLGARNFSLPFFLFWKSFQSNYAIFSEVRTLVAFTTMLAPLSFLVQSAYLLIHGKKYFNEPTWRMGIGFAVLILFLGPSVWEETSTVCRAVIPLTLAFNLLVRQQRLLYFVPLFLIGNIGMLREFLLMKDQVGGLWPSIY